MAVLLALGSALVYGVADFLGGIATKRARYASIVVTVSAAVGITILLLLVPLFPNAHATAADLAWSVAAGVAGAVGVMVFYQALATGTMSVIAPVTAVTSAIVPVTAGIALGERPGAWGLVGVAFAIAAIGLLSRLAPEHEAGYNESERARRGHATVLALIAGLGFGAFFVLLDQTGDDAGMWPLVASRSVVVVLAASVALLARRSFRVPAESRAPAMAAGVFDVGANLFFLLANREGLLSLVGVLASLYPASTIGLAMLVLHERLNRYQVVGLGLAAIAVVLIAAS